MAAAGTDLQPSSPGVGHARATSPARRDLAVFLLSAALLAFEILLLRVFAIAEFYHFAYMAIGVAMLGFGASGSALVLARRLVAGHEALLFELLVATFALALAAAPALAAAVEFDSTRLLWDRSQWLALALLYLALALPFLAGAAALALAFMTEPGRAGRIYAANLAGSALGAGLAIGLLAALPAVRAVGATAVLAAVAAAVLLLSRRSTARVGAALLVLGAAAWVAARPPWTLRVNPLKGLPQVEAFPEARRVGERWGPTGWVVAIDAPAFRHAPGLSLAAPPEMPPQIALFVDGTTAGAATRWGGDPAALTFLDWTPAAAPYAVASPASVLVLGAGPGLEVLNALAHGARHVTAVELNGAVAELAESAVDSASRVYADPRVTLVVGDARAFAARTAERFDLVVLAPLGAFGAGGTGVHGLAEDFLRTTDAYRRYLRLLAPGGILAVTHWVRSPPRDNVKAILTAAAALRAAGTDSVAAAMAFLRSWAAATLLVKPAGFAGDELQRLQEFARSRRFDVDWPPATDSAAPAFNELPRPVFREAAEAAAKGPAAVDAFVDAYPFDVRPATDDRPYAGEFLRLESLPALLRMPPGSWVPFAEWGYLALLATFVQSALAAALLMLLPVAVLARRSRPGRERLTPETGAVACTADGGDAASPYPPEPAPGAPKDALSVPAEPPRPAPRLRAGYTKVAAYFAAIGLAYMFVEIAVIQRLTLLLGHPVYAAAATLAAFLAFSGLGSAWSQRLDPRRLPTACAAATLLALALAAAAPATTALQPFHLLARAAAAVLMVAPLATVMGIPFPLGLRRLATAPTTLAWAWAANGFASVLATSGAALLAIEAGNRTLTAAGSLMYALATLSALPTGTRRALRPTPGP